MRYICILFPLILGIKVEYQEFKPLYVCQYRTIICFISLLKLNVTPFDIKLFTVHYILVSVTCKSVLFSSVSGIPLA